MTVHMLLSINSANKLQNATERSSSLPQMPPENAAIKGDGEAVL